MLTNKRLIKLLALLMVVSLLVAACDRPAPGGGGDEPTPTTEGYPVGGEGEQVVTPEPTRADVDAGESPAEGGEETPAEGGEAGEAPAEGGEETPAEGAEETPAEGAEETPAEGAEETPAEGAEETPAEGAEETPAEGSEETPAEGTEDTPAEGAEETPAESGEETAEEAAPEEQVSESETSAQPLPATHTVAAGENLYRIGLQYGISWVSIARANNITNPDRIFEGQVLTIPGGDSGSGGQPDPVPTPEGINYIVKRGDTLFKIGLQFGISWTEIAEANGLVNPDQIYAGQTLKIPVDAPTKPPVIHHLVQPGETLYRLSLEYGVPWLAIARANNIRPPYIIYAGQTLVIPGELPRE